MTINTNLVCELQSAVKVQYLDGNLFSQDVQGNVINVTVLDGGEPATLSGSVSANIIRADGGTVAATGGTIAGNVASITLPAAAYSVPGVVSIVVKVTDSGVTTTIAAVVANIYQSSTDTVVDPGTIIPSIQTLIAQIDAAVASIPADYSSLWSSLAPNYSIIGFPVYTGYLCTYDGVLYRAKGDILSSETWNSSHWAQVNIGDYIHETKSAFNHSLSVAGENLLSISDFDTPTDSNVTYSVSGGKITITNGSSANYAGLLTSSTFLAKLSTGRMYRFHARCSIDTGNGTPVIAAKAGNNYVNAIYIGVSASTVVDFVVDSNTSAIALMVAFGSSTSGSVVSFNELWVKEMGKDTVARNDIIDLKSASVWNNTALNGIINEDTEWNGGVSNGYYDVIDGEIVSSTKYVKIAKTEVYSGWTIRFKIGSDYTFRVLYWQHSTGDYLPAKATPWHEEPEGYTFYVGLDEEIAIDIRRKDMGKIGTDGHAAVKATIKIYRIGNDKGLLSDLGITSLLDCCYSGIYRSGTAYVSSIIDMPSDFTSGASFVIEVIKPAFASYYFAYQRMSASDGSVWRRVIQQSSGTWRVATGLDWVKIASPVSVKISEENKENIESLNYAAAESIRYVVGQNKAYIKAGDGTVYSGSSFTRWAVTDFIDIEKYDYLVYSQYIVTGSSTDGGIAFYSSNDVSTYISGEYMLTGGADFGIVEKVIKVPAGAKYVRMSIITASGFYIKGIKSNPLKGLKLSLLGASMETYAGWVPEGNDVYYTGTNHGIINVNEMWWKRLCDNTGMTPLVIDAWSGSGVCYNMATDSAHSSTNKIPMCSDLRTGRLGTENDDPDIILIVGGTNDWTYSKSTTTPLGNWNGRTAVDRTAVLAGESTFMESYASMIAKLHENYPNAIVVGVSMQFTCRGTDLGITRVNDMGFTESDYSDAVERVCKIMGIPYIDVYNVGFTYDNYAELYADDQTVSNPATHMNAKGHAILAQRFIEELPRLVKQFVR
jgi:lysophospholipase L1-like esterase